MRSNAISIVVAIVAIGGALAFYAENNYGLRNVSCNAECYPVINYQTINNGATPTTTEPCGPGENIYIGRPGNCGSAQAPGYSVLSYPTTDP